MILLFFTILLSAFSFIVISYSFFNKKNDILFILLLFASTIMIIWQHWYTSALSITFLLLSLLFAKRTTYTQLMTFSMFGIILFGLFMFKFFFYYTIENVAFVIFSSLVILCYLTIQGIFEDDLEKFLIISNFIQAFTIFLDLTVADFSGELGNLGLIKVFNYTITGTLLFLTLGILSKDNRRTKITQLRGSNRRNRLISLCAIIAALSLSGLPGLNMFVSEWLLFKNAFLISPVFTIFGIFMALLMFVMYFKIVYVLSVGDSKVKEKSPWLLNGIAVTLALTCLILGLIPNLQYWILSLVR